MDDIVNVYYDELDYDELDYTTDMQKMMYKIISPEYKTKSK